MGISITLLPIRIRSSRSRIVSRAMRCFKLEAADAGARGRRRRLCWAPSRGSCGAVRGVSRTCNPRERGRAHAHERVSADTALQSRRYAHEFSISNTIALLLLHPPYSVLAVNASQ
eukprot:6211196-Pleurochrysis_carterae.AAC.3